MLAIIPALWLGWAVLRRGRGLTLRTAIRLAGLSLAAVGTAGLMAPWAGRGTVILLVDGRAGTGPAGQAAETLKRLTGLIERENEARGYVFTGETGAGVTGNEGTVLRMGMAGAAAAAAGRSPEAAAVVIASDFRRDGGWESPAELPPAPTEPADGMLPLIRADRRKTYYLLPQGPGKDVRVERLAVPAHFRKGSEISVTAHLGATRPAEAWWECATASGKKRGTIILPAGVSMPVSVVMKAAEGPVTYITFRVTTPGDVLPANDTARTVSFRQGAVSATVTSGSKGTRAREILANAGIKAEETGVEELHRRLVSGRGLPDVIVLENLSMNRHAMTAMAAVPAVRELGVGLLCLGGEESFGAGGLTDGDGLARILPALMKPPGGGGLDITVLLDRSGSMGRRADGAAKIDTVRQAVAAGLAGLKPEDRISIIAFNDKAETVLEDAAYEAERFRNALWAIKAGGGTDVSASLRAAAKAKSDGRRLVFLLTDGDPDRGEAGKLQAIEAAGELRGTVLTVIGTGSAQDEEFLQKTAEAAGGNFVARADAEQVRRTIERAVEEARNPFVARSEEETRFTAGHEIIAGLQPPVTAARNRLGIKAGAQTLGVSGPEETPSADIAVMRTGLGRTGIIAADTGDGWWPELTSDGDGGTLLARTVFWLAGGEERDVSARVDTGRNVLVIETPKEFGAGATTAAVIEKTEGGTGKNIEMYRTGEGRYEARLPEMKPGLYAVTVAGESGSATAPLVVDEAWRVRDTGVDEDRVRTLVKAGARSTSEQALSGRLGEARKEPSMLPYWAAIMVLAAGWLIEAAKRR